MNPQIQKKKITTINIYKTYNPNKITKEVQTKATPIKSPRNIIPNKLTAITRTSPKHRSTQSFIKMDLKMLQNLDNSPRLHMQEQIHSIENDKMTENSNGLLHNINALADLIKSYSDLNEQQSSLMILDKISKNSLRLSNSLKIDMIISTKLESSTLQSEDKLLAENLERITMNSERRFCVYNACLEKCEQNFQEINQMIKQMQEHPGKVFKAHRRSLQKSDTGDYVDEVFSDDETHIYIPTSKINQVHKPKEPLFGSNNYLGTEENANINTNVTLSDCNMLDNSQYSHLDNVNFNTRKDTVIVKYDESPNNQ